MKNEIISVNGIIFKKLKALNLPNIYQCSLCETVFSETDAIRHTSAHKTAMRYYAEVSN